MNKYILIAITLLSAMFFNSCENNSEEIITTKKESIQVKEKETQQSGHEKQSENDALAMKIKDYITTDFLTDTDLEAIPAEQRKFQFHQIDLNNDGKNEIFVKFTSSYFCGSGGCTILLLSNQFELITKFTVTKTPLFAEQTLKNGWRILLTKSEGELKELTYTNETYPSNPSLLEKAPYDAPSGHSEVMFDPNFNNPRSYNF